MSLDQWAGPSALWAGASAPWRAFRLLARQPALWPLCLLPTLINVVLLGAFVFGLFTHLPGWLEAWLPRGEGWWWAWLYYLALIVVGLLALGVGLLLLASLGRVLAAPFLDVLARRVEIVVSGAPAPPGPGPLATVARVLRQETLKLLLYAALTLALTFLGLLAPLLGGAASAALGWLLTTFFLALEFMDYPLERRGLGLGGKIAAVWRTTPGWLGLGGALMALGLIPLLNLLFLPLAAVAGTLYYLESRSTN